MYSGYLSANEIISIAEVPRYGSTQRHLAIASGIPPHHTPVEKWQRPLDNSKVKGIAEVYSSDTKNNLMPNPVILATAQLGGATILPPEPVMLSLGDVSKQAPNLFTFKIPVSNPKKIWILDGQHRVFGMQETANSYPVDRSDAPIPFILLHGTTYTAPMLAEIFTYVTSKATEMDKIHRAWMHYSFKIPEYDDPDRQDSMETVTHLCTESDFGPFGGIPSAGTVNNPFYDNIRFNPDLTAGYFAFQLDAKSLADDIFKNYYKKLPNGAIRLAPKDLAEQLVYAIKAIEYHDDNKQGSLHPKGGSRLFDDSPKAPLKMLGDCFITAVLHYLRTGNRTSMTGWKNFLGDGIREFDKADWKLDWVSSLDGSDQNDSKKVAIQIFKYYLSTTAKPSHRIDDYLRGAGAELEVISYYWDPVKKRRRTGASYPSNTTTISVGASIQSATMGSASAVRTGVTVQVPDNVHNIVLRKIHDCDINPNEELEGIKKIKGIDIDYQLNRTAWGTAGKLNIVAKTISFSGITSESTLVRLDKK